MIVEGQVHGGIAQGVGQALLEGVVYDKDGQLVTASYMDYCMPRADDLPSFNVGLTVTPCPSNPLGIKGCGEAGAIAAPAAVINAITDAVGHEDVPMPATPQVVWRAAQKAMRRMAANSRRAARAGRVAPVAPLATRYSLALLEGTHPCTHSPTTSRHGPSGRRHARPQGGRKAAGRRAHAAADHEATARLPANLVDLGAVAEMKGIERKGRAVVIGAMTTHAEVAASAVVQEAIPGLAALAEGIGDPHVRHRGTIGGSVANNDRPPTTRPHASPWARRSTPTSAESRPTTSSRPVRDRAGGRRDHHEDRLPHSRQGGLRQVPQPGLALRAGRRLRRQARLGGARRGDGRGKQRRLPLDGRGGGPEKRFSSKSLEGVAASAKGLNGDIHADAEYRAHLIGVMARRAVDAAVGK